EFPGLRETHSRDRGEATQQPAHDGGRTVDLQLGTIFACKTLRTRHPRHKPCVDHLAVETKKPQRKTPRLDMLYRQLFQNATRLRSADANHSDARGQGT